MTRGYFAIGIDHGKTVANLGTLWRAANLFGAAFIFTVGHRYRSQCSDTLKTPRHVPLIHYASAADLVAHLPHSCPLVGVELTDEATPLDDFRHPQRAVYLLGAEDHGLTKDALAACHHVVKLPGRFSMNVACAGSIVMYDRETRGTSGLEIAS